MLKTLSIAILLSIALLMLALYCVIVFAAWTVHWSLGLSAIGIVSLVAAGQWASEYLKAND